MRPPMWLSQLWLLANAWAPTPLWVSLVPLPCAGERYHPCGGAWPEFIGFACSRLRGVEADLRDELSRVAAAVPGDRPPPPGAATEGSRPSHSQTPKKEATASASAPGPLQAAQPPPPPAPGGLTNKAPPLQPPAHLQEKPESKVEKKVKEEPADEDKPNQEQGVVEVELQETNASGSGSKPENPP